MREVCQCLDNIQSPGWDKFTYFIFLNKIIIFYIENLV